MSPIYFCRHVKKQHAREFKRVPKLCAAERAKKAKDEEARKARLAVGNEGYGSPTP